MGGAPTVVDPRPDVTDDGLVLGGRCDACGHAVARRTGRCDLCGGTLSDASFGPGGTVWSATIVHLPVGPRPAGFVLVSVDVDDGPRVLMRWAGGGDVPEPGARVQVVGRADDETADLLVGARRSSAAEHPIPARTTAAEPAAEHPTPTRTTATERDRVVISGVGTSHFGRFTDRRIEELAWEAIVEALDDADVEPGDIDAAVVGSVFGPPGLANRVLAGVGLAGVPTFQVEAACASGTVAFHQGHAAVAAGGFRRVLAVGVEQLSTQFTGPIVPEPTDPEGRTGLAMPALYALQAARHLHDHRLDPDLLAHVAVKNKRHGAANPRAHLGDDGLTIERVLDSRPIAGPLTLLQCCPMTDGAAAAVIESATTTRDRRHDRGATVLASAFASGAPWGSHTSLPWGFETVRSTATRALAAASVEVGDVDLFEVHDAFTIGEVLTIEAIGLAPPGRGLDLTANGETALGGPHPVNPSGGLLSRGHPLGATGLAQLAEAVWQLRGEADDRQVDGATTALVETMGGGAAGVDANACVVAVLRGPT